MPRKIDYAVAATDMFIRHMHREGVDRGMIATFGNTARVECPFTTSERSLRQVLCDLPDALIQEGTLLYDGIGAVIGEFWKRGRRDVPWFLIIITDGQDNASENYKNDPVGIGRYIANRFNHEPSNFLSLIGVGTGKQIDSDSLARMAEIGGFPAMTVAGFPLLEELFVRIAIRAIEQVVGKRISLGNATWSEVAVLRQRVHVPVDYVFFIDRSGSMSELG